jgi:hypothetical protein
VKGVLPYYRKYIFSYITVTFVSEKNTLFSEEYNYTISELPTTHQCVVLYTGEKPTESIGGHRETGFLNVEEYI